MESDNYHLIIIVLLIVLILIFFNRKEHLGIVDRVPLLVPKDWKEGQRTLWNPWWFYENSIETVPEISNFPLTPEGSAGRDWSLHWLSPVANQLYVSNKPTGCTPCNKLVDVEGDVRREEELDELVRPNEQLHLSGPSPDDPLNKETSLDSNHLDVSKLFKTETFDENIEGLDNTVKHEHKHVHNYPNVNLNTPLINTTPPIIRTTRNAYNSLFTLSNLSVLFLVTLVIFGALSVYYKKYGLPKINNVNLGNVNLSNIK